MSTWLKDASMREEIARKDYSEELKAKLPIAKNLAQGGKLAEGCEVLLAVEKQSRLANDVATLRSTCQAILELCYEAKNWQVICEQVVLLAKRRSQKSGAITTVVQQAMKYLDEVPTEALKVELIVALRSVSDGKIFVEKERAELTQMLSQIKEKNGDVVQAANILQEVHVETYGAMTLLEKVVFILEQVRLTIAKKDFIRALILAKKIQRKTLEDEGFEECKLKFYKLMIEYDTHENNPIELCRHYLSIFNTSTVKADEKQWKDALQHAVLFVILSPHSNHQHDLLHRIAQEKLLEDVPVYKELIKLFTTKEIIPTPLPISEDLSKHSIFATEGVGAQWLKDLRTRIIQHNVLVLEAYYKRVRMNHVEKLLGLTANEVEEQISTLVCDGSIYARINRPAGIVSFQRPQPPEEQLTGWSSSIGDLLKLVETTCHLIHKENMTYKI